VHATPNHGIAEGGRITTGRRDRKTGSSKYFSSVLNRPPPRVLKTNAPSAAKVLRAGGRPSRTHLAGPMSTRHHRTFWRTPASAWRGQSGDLHRRRDR
jgi:hypothetical protein